MTDDLKPKKVKVGGKTLTVFEAEFVHSLQRSVRIADAGKETPKYYAGLNLSDDVVTYIHRLLYPSLVSCTQGPVPTEEEFIHLKDREVNTWLDAAQERNPDWFSLNRGSQETDEKKG